MHGVILPHNIFLIAFVLHNLTPSQARSLFFPSIIDLDSAVNYFHSPKFNIAMKSFKQELSKYMRSVFIDLSVNVASKLKHLYDTVDTIGENKILPDTFLQPAKLSSMNTTELETKLTPKENPLPKSNSSKLDVAYPINSTDGVLKELNFTVIGRTDQKKVKMKNSTRRKKPRLRGRLTTSVNSSDQQGLNYSKNSAVLGRFNLQTGSNHVNDSTMHPAMTNTENDSGVLSISAKLYTTTSGTILTENLKQYNELNAADMFSRPLNATMQSNFSNLKENPDVNQKTSIVGHKDFHNFNGTTHTPATTFIPKADEIAFNSSLYDNSSLLETPSVGRDTTKETNKTLKTVVSHSALDLRFPGPYRSSEHRTLEKNSDIIKKQPVLPVSTKDGNNINFKHTADLNASKPILMTEEERKLLLRKSKRRIIMGENKYFHRKKRNASNVELEVVQPSTHSILTVARQNLTVRQIPQVENSSKSITKFLPYFELKGTKAIDNNHRKNSSERLRNKVENISLGHQEISKSGAIDDILNSFEVDGSQNLNVNLPEFPKFESEALKNFKLSQESDANRALKNQGKVQKFVSPSTIPLTRNKTNSKELKATEASTSTEITGEKNLNVKVLSIPISMPILLGAPIPEKTMHSKSLIAEKEHLDVLSLYQKAGKNGVVRSSSIPSTMRPVLLVEIVEGGTALFKSKAANEKNNSEQEVILRGRSKADMLYNEQSSRINSIHKDETNSQITKRPHKGTIKSRIKKRAAYDALMSMIANRWAKVNNEEAESDETVTDDMQYDDNLESKMKEPIKVTPTKKINKADRERVQTETHDFSDPVKISKHYEPSLQYDLNGKISNLCLSFDAMNRKSKTGILLSDQPATASGGILTTSVAALPKLKRSFPEKNNQTNKVVKRKRKQKHKKLKTVTVPSRIVSETDQLLDIAIEQFEDKLKSIIQSSWPSKNFRDPAQKSEDFAGGNVYLAPDSLAQKDLHSYVISTCKQARDQPRKQYTSETEDTDIGSESLEEEAMTEGIRTTDLAATSTGPLPVTRLGYLLQTTPYNSVTKKTSIKIQKTYTDRKTPSSHLENSREPVSNKQHHLENVLAVNESGKDGEKQQLFYCSSCVPMISEIKTREESGGEPTTNIDTSQTSTSSTTAEILFQPSEPQYSRLNFPITAITGMPDKLVDSDELEALTQSVPNNKKDRDDNIERVYQPSLDKPKSESYFYTTKKPSHKNPTSRHTIQRPPPKDNIMRLDRKLENFWASPSDAAVSYSQSPENLRKSIENFKKIARLNWELLKNIKADDGFSIAEFNPESLGLSPLLNKPTEGTDDGRDENLEDESETLLSTQSSHKVAQSLVISLKTSPREAETPSLLSTPKEGYFNDDYAEPNSFIDRGSAQSFREVNMPQKRPNTSGNSPLSLFTRSEVHGYNNQEMLTTVDQLVSPRIYSTQGRGKLMTTLFNQRSGDGNESKSSALNQLELFDQNHDYKEPYKPESSRRTQQSKEENEFTFPVQNHGYTEDGQNQKPKSQVRFQKPKIMLQYYNPESVNPRRRYDVISTVDKTLESYYGEPPTEAVLDENSGSLFIEDLREPYLSSATKGMVSESDYNSPVMKSETYSYLVKVKPNVAVSQLRNKTTPLIRKFTTAGIRTRQEMSGRAETQIQQPMMVQDGDQAEFNSRTGAKHGIAHRRPYLFTAGQPRLSDTTNAAEDRRPFRTKYHEEEPQYNTAGNTEYHDEGLTTNRPYMEESPSEESQTYSTLNLGHREEPEVGVQKHRIASIESPTVEPYFHPKPRRPLNRTSSRKRHRKLRIHGGTSDTGHGNRTSGIDHMSSTEHLFEKFESFNTNSIGLNTEKSNTNERIDEWHSKEERDKGVSKTESHIEETMPRLSLLNGSRSKRRRFYNRGNNPLSQLYGKEYTTSRYFLSSSRAQFFFK